jgi:ubiquinone/menaquinone biosynthesis C-methylase UbiE
MASPYLSPYEDPAAHASISALIRRHSSNREDVREAMLKNLDLAGAEEVLDLGCGFGFWTEGIAGRVPNTARFTGIDACEGNEHSYLQSVESTGRTARFICATLDRRLPFDDNSFDLVIAAYSLYFFAHIVHDVARVLRPEGRFLAVTHSEDCFAGLLGAVGLSTDDSPLARLIREFSAENGEALLARDFPQVARVDYRNSLSFRREGLPEAVTRRASQSLHSRGRVIVQKNDTLFICGGPDGR